MNPQPTFLQYLTGTDNFTFYKVEWLFALIGVVLSLALQVAKRDPASLATPYKFSLKFLLLDNGKRLLASAILIFIFLRFPDQFLATQIASLSDTWRLFIALSIGFANDKLAQMAKNYNFLGMFGSSTRKPVDNETPPHTDNS